MLDGLLGVEGHVRRHDYVGEAHEDGAVAVGQHVSRAVEVVEPCLGLDGVERRGADLARLDGVDEGGGVDERPARGVDDDDAILHARELLGADHVLVLGEAGGVQRDHVGAGQKLVERHVLDAPAQAVLRVGVAGDDSAPEAGEALADGLTDGACAHDAHGAGVERAADLSPQAEVLVARGDVDELGLAKRHEDEHHSVIGDARGRVGRMPDADAETVRRVEVDVVEADGARGEAADTELGVARQELGGHRVGDDGDRVVALHKLCVVHRGVLGGPAELETVLVGEPLKDRQLVVGAQRISEELHVMLPFFMPCLPILALWAQSGARGDVAVAIP